MPVFIKSFFEQFFPSRQLLIRQNGEVKHVILAPWLQIFVVLLVLITLSWVSISSYRIYSQTTKISAIEQAKLDEQKLWQQQASKQQALHLQQAEQLAELEQKQALLQSMIESLPASISKDALNEDDLASPSEQLQEQFHDPLVDEAPHDKQAQHLDEHTFAERYAQLNRHYQQNFTFLEKQINTRHQAILAMLKGAGLESALEQHLALSDARVAQGGPLDIFDESKIPSTFLAIADKLLQLNTLENFLNELPNTLPLPAAKYYISSNFGLRKDPMNNRRAFHKGVDLAGWHKKTEIFAPADATVLRAGRNGGYGNFIELEHKNGLVTRFGHLNKIKVKKGQAIAKNDVIGLMGSTGRSTSTHLHYEVLLDGKHVNPLKITKALSRVR